MNTLSKIEKRLLATLEIKNRITTKSTERDAAKRLSKRNLFTNKEVYYSNGSGELFLLNK